MPVRVLTRLKKRREFVAVSRAGRRWSCPSFQMQALKNPSSSGTRNMSGPLVRFGFTATRKLGNAVERNRAKRRLRACLQTLERTDYFRSLERLGIDYVLIARSGVFAEPFDRLKESVMQGLVSLSRRCG